MPKRQKRGGYRHRTIRTSSSRRSFRGHRMNAWMRWLPGLQMLRRYEAALAAARPDGRPGADHDAGAGRHRVRGGLRRAGHLRPVRHDRPAAGLRAVRSEPHPGAGAGFRAGRGDSRGRAAALGRRPDARRGAGEHDGGGVGAGVHPGRRDAPGLRHRAAVQADPLRLHERHRAHRADQPAAQAVRLLDRRATGRFATSSQIAKTVLDGQVNWTAFAIGAGTLVSILLLKRLEADSRAADCSRRRDRRGRRARPGRKRRGEGTRTAAAGPAIVRAAVDRVSPTSGRS